MKKMWVVLSLAMLGFVSQSFAATFDKGLITDTTGFENTITSPIDVDQPFSDTWNFTTPANVNSVAISITNVAINFGKFTVGAINNFQAKFNGEALEFEEVGSDFVLVKVLSGAYSVSQTSHVLEITGVVPAGNLTGSYGGNMTVAAAELPKIPVPAAVWLFGSALLGLFGIGRRKEIISA